MAELKREDNKYGDTVVFPATILQVTANALLVFNEDANEEAWVPRSAVVDSEDLDEYTEDFEMSEWKAKDLGWA